MLITGTMTLVVAICFWSVLTAQASGTTVTHPLLRLFFPDSPTTAWFLTPDERRIAVQRIKVITP